MNSMGSDFKRTGGCQCGAVRYTIHAPAVETYHCHCEMCRKLQGVLFGTFSGVPRDQITIDKGADNLTTYDSSPPNHRKFCKTFGSCWGRISWTAHGTDEFNCVVAGCTSLSSRLISSRICHRPSCSAR